MIGSTLAHYTILDAIGAGGMGVVYRARDTKLERDVAIKVLPEEFARDQERLERFTREARLLAQLNHTNIATLYGLEELDGRQFLVMELVEGETLAERIARGPIPGDEAIALFVQIAEGVEAAHEKGIIHRDLKPPNIKVGPDGHVKILDFGLAKMFAGDADPAVASSQSPTLTKGTALGAIMGTTAYMSPEQARGKIVDRRTDIWAFGVCLYEVFTGDKPFDGDNVTDVLAAVVRAEPDWAELDRRAPAHVRALVRKCLRKDARQRLRDIGDARVALQDGPQSSREVHPRRSLVPYALGLAALCLAAGLALGGLLRPNDVDRSVQRVVVPLPPDVRMVDRAFGGGRELKISPDGTLLVFTGIHQGTSEHQLFLRQLDEREARPIPGTDGAFQPFFSPDGAWLGFHAGGALMKMPVIGAAAIRVCTQSEPMGASWGDDGFIYFAQTASGESNGIYRVPEEGGTPERVTFPDQDAGEVAHWWPEILPDGTAVLFATTGNARGISVVSLADGARRDLIARGGRPMYASTGHLLYHSGLTDYAIPFDLERLETSGASVPLPESISRMAVSATGTLAFTPWSRASSLRRGELVWVGRDGWAEPVTEGPRAYQPHPRIAPDGRRIAVTSGPAGEFPNDIWTLDIERGVFSRITTGTSAGIRPVWSGDGSRIFFASNRDGNFEIFSKSSDGTGAETPLLSGAYRLPSSVSGDGDLLFFRESSAGSDWDIGVLRLDAESEPEILLGSKFNETTATLSPDTKWLAYVSDESGQLEVYVTSFPELDRRQQVSKDGGAEPRWAPSGLELFYRRGDAMMKVPVNLGTELEPGAPVELFRGRFQRGDVMGGGLNTNTNYDVFPRR